MILGCCCNQKQYEQRRAQSAYSIGKEMEGGFDEGLFEIACKYDFMDAATSTGAMLLWPKVSKALIGTATGRAVQKELDDINKMVVAQSCHKVDSGVLLQQRPPPILPSRT